MKTGNTKGVTLFEILVGVFIFTLAMGALFNSILTVLYLIDISQDQTVAVSDLRNIMEKIKATAFADVTTAFPDGVQDGPGGSSYQNMIGSYALNSEHITVTYPNTNSDPLEIKAGLTWKDKKGRSNDISLSTFKTR